MRSAVDPSAYGDPVDERGPARRRHGLEEDRHDRPEDGRDRPGTVQVGLIPDDRDRPGHRPAHVPVVHARERGDGEDHARREGGEGAVRVDGPAEVDRPALRGGRHEADEDARDPRQGDDQERAGAVHGEERAGEGEPAGGGEGVEEVPGARERGDGVGGVVLERDVRAVRIGRPVEEDPAARAGRGRDVDLRQTVVVLDHGSVADDRQVGPSDRDPGSSGREVLEAEVGARLRRERVRARREVDRLAGRVAGAAEPDAPAGGRRRRERDRRGLRLRHDRERERSVVVEDERGPEDAHVGARGPAAKRVPGAEPGDPEVVGESEEEVGDRPVGVRGAVDHDLGATRGNDLDRETLAGADVGELGGQVAAGRRR